MKDIPGQTPEAAITAHTLVAHWESLDPEVSSQVKDKLGILYVEHILGLGKEKADEFFEGVRNGKLDDELSHQVGMAQAVVTAEPDDIEQFWLKAQELEPKILPSSEDLQFLIEQDHSGSGAFFLLESLGGLRGRQSLRPSAVIRELKVNAHIYR